MKGQQQVIDLLNEILTGELTAINQYFLHSRMCKNWGLKRIAEHIYKESIDEMKHADTLVERILFLEGLPNLQKLDKIMIGQTPREIFTNDLAVEMAALPRFNAAIATCRSLGDNATEDMLTKMLVSEEEHVDWLETQIDLMKQLGDQVYLAQQIHD